MAFRQVNAEFLREALQRNDRKHLQPDEMGRNQETGGMRLLWRNRDPFWVKAIIGTKSIVNAIRRISPCGGLLGTGARTLTAATSTLLVFGLFVLFGVTTHPGTALAQGRDDCPLPPGVTPPPDPTVTAQDVESGSATLGEFALAVTAQFKSSGSETVSAEQLAFAGCRLRLERGPFRAGSTYIVTLTPDGRVYLHAKDMSLSAGRLKPAIYAGILSALDVPEQVLAGLQSPDPGARGRAQFRLREILRSEPHDSFDLTSAVPGASGYAAAYVSVNTEQPLVLLAGFDLDASHLGTKTSTTAIRRLPPGTSWTARR